MNNPYPALDDVAFRAVAEGRYIKSSYSNGNAGCVSFALVDDLVGLQDDKLPLDTRKARTLVFTRDEIRAFVLGAKNGEFDHLV
ncbi:DUF397 domain-containing protein [Kibdelosporangium aridum]|uniref:DUF397 domain-containing protein n=1 Tax=Kibdelosporangium aridum TaxID=2030 RepID=UPI00068F42D0